MTRALASKHLSAQRAVAFIFLVLIGASLVGAHVSEVARLIQKGERVAVVVFGVDAADASQHTDTLMISVLDPLKKSLSVMSLPRDSRIDLPGFRFRRINEIYGYFFRKTQDSVYASQKVLEGLGEVLSFDQTRVSFPYFLRIDYSGFTRIIDILGGVWIHVRHPMHYDDNAGRYHFHKEPGRYLMDGSGALAYVRFRGHTGDRGRILRQQEFVRVLAGRMANPFMLFRWPQILSAFASMVKTNLTFWDAVYLFTAARHLRSDHVGFFILPGKPQGAFWALNKEALQPLMTQLLHGDVPAEKSPPEINEIGRTTVKVWNASGKKGMAYHVTKYLRSQGFDVLDWGNFEAEQAQTRIIDRMGQIDRAQAIAHALGVQNFHSEPNPQALVDVEVVIGQNYSPAPE